MSYEAKSSTPYVRLTRTSDGAVIDIKHNGTDLLVQDSAGNEVTINGVKITAHASRHNRGGADAIDWSSISKYKKVSGAGGTVGVSGSPATFTVMTLDTNYYNLLPLVIKIGPTGLGTGESLSLSVVLKDASGTSYTVWSATGVTTAQTVTISDINFDALNDGIRIVEIDVTAESSATSTSASVSIDAVALET